MKNLIKEIRGGGYVSYDRLKEKAVDYFPLIKDLKNTPQDKVWHAEGDVEIHTSRVIDEIYSQMDKNEIKGEERVICVLSALLHDIAKPLTTREREDPDRVKIIAPRHATRGRSYLAYKIFDLGLSYDSLTTILELVGLHHRPKWYVMDDKSESSYALLNRRVDPKFLYVLEMADILGRDCADRQTQIDYIELFRLFSEEYGVYGKGKDPFSRWFSITKKEIGSYSKDLNFLEQAVVQGFYDYSKGLIYTPEEAASRAMGKLGKNFPQLIITCGPSGSGKSTWVSDNYGDFDVVSMDKIREKLTGERSDQSLNGKVIQEAKELLKVSLRKNGKVVWDATNLREDFRNLPFRIAKDYNSHITLAVFHMPESHFFDRNREREHQVPDSVLEGQLNSVQFPSINDAHRVLFIDGEGDILKDTRDYFKDDFSC